MHSQSARVCSPRVIPVTETADLMGLLCPALSLLARSRYRIFCKSPRMEFSRSIQIMRIAIEVINWPSDQCGPRGKEGEEEKKSAEDEEEEEEEERRFYDS